MLTAPGTCWWRRGPVPRACKRGREMTRSWGCGENLFSNYWRSGNLDDLERWRGWQQSPALDTNLLAPGRSAFLLVSAYVSAQGSNNSTKLDDGLLGSKQERMSDTGGGCGPGRVLSYQFLSPCLACSEDRLGAPRGGILGEWMTQP